MANQAQTKSSIIIDAANKLLTANNTVTTLEIKTELRKTHGTMWWDQQSISDTMRQASTDGCFDFIDNGTFRVYSGTPTRVPANKAQVTTVPPATKRPVGRPRKSIATVPTTVPTTPPIPAPAAKKAKTKVVAGLKFTGAIKYISRVGAKKMMSDNKGHFFTAVFTDKKGKERTMNCQWLKDQTGADLGYVKVKEAALVREAKAVIAANNAGNTMTKVPSVIRNVNLQTLKAIKIAGQLYKVR